MIPKWLSYGTTGWGYKDKYYISTGGPFLRNGKYKPYDMGHGPYPYSWTEGRGPRFAWWFRSMEADLYNSYDLLYKSTYFNNKKSPDGKNSFRYWVENSIFDNQAEYMLSFPWLGQIKNNLPLHVSDLTKVAMVCGRPEYARFARDWCKALFYNYMSHHDMVTLEGPGYHNCWIAHGRPTYEVLAQYNDPPNYVDEQGVSLIGFDPREEPAKRRQFWGTSMMHYPDGSTYPVGDSGRFKKGSLSFSLRKSINRIAPGFGLTILGDGTLKNKNQMQAILNWNAGGHSHSHEDVNHFFLFANGRELLSEMYAGWAARMTSEHNTVSIDGKNNAGKNTSAGSLELYTPKLPGVSIVRVESKMAAYPELANRYRRTLINNTVDLKHPYVVDIFEVQGGSKHDYFLQGCSEKRYPQKGSSSIQLGSFSKPAPKDPQSISSWDGYENLKSAKMTKDGYVDFCFEDNSELGTRTHFQQDDALELILGEVPNMAYRTNHGYSKTLRKHMPKYKTIPKLILRHQGENNLSTNYVLVHEVISGSSVIKGIKHQINTQGVLSVEVDLGERKDYYTVALEKPGVLESGPLKAEGTFAAAVTKNGKCDIYTTGASKAECLGRTLNIENSIISGSVERITRQEDGAPRDAYLSNAVLSPGDTLKNEVVMLEFFDVKGKKLFNLSSEIDEVIADGDKCWIVIKQDAGVVKHKDGSWEEIFYPKRKASSCRLKVITSATTVPQLKWTPKRDRYEHFDTNSFIAVGESTQLKVVCDDSATPISISGDMSAQGMGSVELKVDREVKLLLKALNTEGVMNTRASEIHILPQAKAQPINKAKLNSGIAWKHYYQRADLKSIDSLKFKGEGVSKTISDFKTLGRDNSMIFTGWIDVPASGKYTFFTRAAGGCLLDISNKRVSSAINFERDVEFKAEVNLEKGLHPIRFAFGHSRETGLFHLKWSGPGFSKEEIPASTLKHSEK